MTKTKFEEESDLSEELQNGDGGALTEDEGSTDQSHNSPNCEEDSGEERGRRAGSKVATAFCSYRRPRRL